MFPLERVPDKKKRKHKTKTKQRHLDLVFQGEVSPSLFFTMTWTAENLDIKLKRSSNEVCLVLVINVIFQQKKTISKTELMFILSFFLE